MEIKPMNTDVSLELKMLEKKMEVMLDTTLKKFQTLIMGLQSGIDKVSSDIQQVQNRMIRLEDKAYERPSFDQNAYATKAASEPAAQGFQQPTLSQLHQEHSQQFQPQFSRPNQPPANQQAPHPSNGFRREPKAVPIYDATTGQKIEVHTDDDAPKPRYGDYTPNDVSVDKFFYFGGKR